MRNTASRGAADRRSGMTLVEVMTVMAIMAILLTFAAPSFNRTMEQAQADLAGANLEIIWNAQRFFWLENQTYAPSLATLEAAGLIDATMTNSNRYAYSINSADSATFEAEAARISSTTWTGSLTIDEMGGVAGSISDGTVSIVPGYQ